MATYSMMRAGNFFQRAKYFCRSFQYRSNSLTNTNIFYGSRIKTLHNEFIGAKACWKDRTVRFHATSRQFSTIMATEPMFTVTYDVNGGAESYRRFIRDIRQHVESPNFAGQVRMLNPEAENWNNWFHIVLIDGSDRLTLRMNYGNLWFQGFQAGSQWYEFNDNNRRTISGAQWLPFTSSYPNNTTILERTQIGLGSLRGAVRTLANYNRQNENNNRESAVRLMIMIAESIRFNTVERFVYERMRNVDSIFGDTMVDLIKNWGNISMECRRSDLFATFNELRATRINSTEQASRVLALGLWSHKTPPPPKHMYNASEAINDVNIMGRQLVEIFWVQILDIDNENPGDLYGSIHVMDGLFTNQYIFRRSQKKYLSIRPKEFIPLTGPTRAISAFDSFCIDVSLMDYDVASPDDEVSMGQIEWNYFADNVYNQPITTEVKGKYGSAAICYGVYSNAVLATVQVKLINGDDENPANVYGTLDASNTLSNQPINLFNKQSHDYVDIRPQAMIPLRRSMVVVPLGHSVKVAADLWDQDTLSRDDPIAQGSVTFSAATSGSNSALISGKYGLVEVTVTWSSSFA